MEKLIEFRLVKKFPAFYGTRRFLTAFTSPRHLSLSWASSIQSMTPHPTSWSSILILSSHLRLGLSSGLSPSGFPTITLYMPLFSPYVLHVPPILFFSICSREQYWEKSTDHEAPHYVYLRWGTVIRGWFHTETDNPEMVCGSWKREFSARSMQAIILSQWLLFIILSLYSVLFIIATIGLASRKQHSFCPSSVPFLFKSLLRQLL